MAEVIVALDLPGSEARRLLDRIPEVRWAKVGPILFTREGPALVGELRARGIQVFLDLKWHDIPNTVAGAVEAAVELGVAMATVHTLGGREMLVQAARASAGRLGVVGVTVLTSHTATAYAQCVGRGGEVVVPEEVARLTVAAREAGLRGVVCSPLEVAAARSLLPADAWLVVPGIRRASDPAGDQSRSATPEAAAGAGATHLVVGRPVLQAADPRAVFLELREAAST